MTAQVAAAVEMQRWQSWKPYTPCPCGCGVMGWKLTKPLDHESPVQHVVGCSCRRHLGKRNQKKGKAGQAKMHRNLGGTGPTPSQEESARVYPPIVVMPESKVGGQVPASFDKFIKTEWFRRALDQNVRGIPYGSGAKPSVMIRGRWLIVDTGTKRGAA